MKELIRPFEVTDSYEEQFAEAMCSENDCNCTCTWSNENATNGNLDFEKEDDILF